MLSGVLSLIHIFSIFIVSVSGYETVHDAAIIARRLIDHSSTSIGTMATVFPSSDDLAGLPFSMQEYYASCYQNGSLTLLFLPISRHSKNVLNSPHQSASISVTSEVPAARLPRVSLIGNITVFTNTSAIPDLHVIKQCYLEKHPDSKWWLPDDDDAAHISYWARFDPQRIYFVGGFGGAHYIGFIPLDLYQKACIEEVDEGKGTQKEWSEISSKFRYNS